MFNMYSEEVPAETNVKRFEKSGSLTASPHTEATAFALSANGELTDTYVDATAAAIACVSARSIHLQRFGGAKGSIGRFLDEQGKAIARYVDNDALSLFASVSATVTSTAGATFDDLYLGQYTIFNGNCPDLNLNLRYIASPRALQQLKVVAQAAGAAAFANDIMLGIFSENGGKPLPNGYMGVICPGIEAYQTTGFQTTGGDTQHGLVHPIWGLAGIFDSSIIVRNAEKISEGFYDEVGSVYFYDVIEYHAAACVQMKSDT